MSDGQLGAVTISVAMGRLALLALSLLIGGGSAAVAPPVSAHVADAAAANAASPVACRASAKRAVIGGRVQCLRTGLACNARFNTTKPSYTRFGFLCAARFSDTPTTLFRIAQPGPAPSTCPGIGSPPPEATAPGFRGVGSPPFYVGPYLNRETDTTVWHYSRTPGLLGTDGWAVKFVWYVAPEAAPARISITKLNTGRPVNILVHGQAGSRSPILQSNTMMANPPNTWGSFVAFPAAGCYRLDSQWQGGMWSLVFSFGR
jgi:hypothetical protein